MIDAHELSKLPKVPQKCLNASKMLKDVEGQVASSEAQLKGFSFGCGPAAQQGCPMCCEYSVIFSYFFQASQGSSRCIDQVCYRIARFLFTAVSVALGSLVYVLVGVSSSAKPP